MEYFSTVRLGVFNTLGELVQTQSASVAAGENTIDLNLNGLPPGAYIVRLTDGKSVGSVKLIKQ